MLDTVKPESIGLLNFSSPNGQLSEPGRTLLQGKGVPEEEEPLISASWSQPRSRFLADEQPHHGRHSALRKLLQGMNSQEPALMFLYAAEPQHDHEAVHLQLSDMVASGRLGDAIRAAGFQLSDIHLVAFEPVFGDHMPHDGISGMSVRRPWRMSFVISSGRYCQQNMTNGTCYSQNQSCVLTCSQEQLYPPCSLTQSCGVCRLDGHR